MRVGKARWQAWSKPPSRRWKGLARGAPTLPPRSAPCIGPKSYEVGPEFVAAFANAGEDIARYFTPSHRDGHSMFNLNAYIAERAARAGVGRFEDLGLDTYADERRFFSYRRATHRKEPDYGRPPVGHRHELSRGRAFPLLDRSSARDQLRPGLFL